MPWYKNKYSLAGVMFLVLLILVSLGYAIFHKSPSKQATNNFNTISDTSTGITFNMSKRFEPIPKAELAALNPGFNYGFRPANDALTSCIISQTALKGSGTLTGSQLRDGILKEVKKIHPDVKLKNRSTASNPVKFGETKGVLLELTYKDANTAIKRVEILAFGKATQVIAYCQSAEKDNPRYYNDFTIFFSSLKLQ